MAAILFISCKDNGKRTEVGQDGIVEIGTGQSQYYAEYKKALKLLEENKASQAIAIYKNLCKIEDENSKTDAYLGLGSAYSRFGDYQKAIENYKISINYNHKNAEIYVGLGSAWFSLNYFDSAARCYSYARKLDPNNADCYWGLALAYDELKMKDSAKANATRFIELAPQSNYRNLVERIMNK